MSISLAQNLVAVGTGAAGVYYLGEWFKGGKCTNTNRLDGKTVIVTGCNTGIGKETVRDLLGRGAKVILACRNLEAANKAVEEIIKDNKDSKSCGELGVIKLDLSSLDSVRDCAKDILEKEDRIDILINNAGVMIPPYTKTKENFELQIGTNHLGHFLFTNLLLDRIKASAPARIINVSSRAHEDAREFDLDLDDLHWEKRSYNRVKAYSASKLANVMFTNELDKRLKGSGVTCYSLHPGVVRTELFRYIEDILGKIGATLTWGFVWYFTKSPKEGAQTTIYCATQTDLGDEKFSGKYFADCKVKAQNPIAENEILSRRLWDVSMQEVGLDKN